MLPCREWGKLLLGDRKGLIDNAAGRTMYGFWLLLGLWGPNYAQVIGPAFYEKLDFK